ncbi:RNA-binding protein 10 [Armadillidium nasatum]|uniref:RNA-binding protein 10 n=1 Tax=Armadillidium nasatum TaxID=96803 RepID=A0A5N5SYQ7_9CRUS|nr:RNA-binding protein 10 [Armadillidium nasatum]
MFGLGPFQILWGILKKKMRLLLLLLLKLNYYWATYINTCLCVFLRLGASRGFAFVEFTTVHDATRWMEAKQGVLILQEVYRATLQYSIPKEASDRQNKQSQDWFCIRCGAHNFKRRDSCFKCSAPRHESEAGEEGSDEICNYPTNMLLFRGLDILSTEEGVLQSIEPLSNDLPIRSVRIGRDPLTNTSRGVCYVELNSVLDSMQLYNKLAADPPIIDSKQTTISYCKLNQGVNHNSTQQQQQHHQPIEYTAGADIKKLAEYSASVYAQTPEEHAAYVEYYTMYYQQQAQAVSSGTQSDSVNAAAAVAQSALQAMQQKTGMGAAVAAATAAAQISYNATSPSATLTATTASSTDGVPIASNSNVTAPIVGVSYDQLGEDYPKYPTPDVSTYKYDESSGYYYDPSTGLYYDANSTYYYNAESGQYLYWDAEKSTYLPAPTSDESQDGQDGKGKDKKEKDRDKQDKVKVAKKIAKDMERWAKAQNKRNESSTKSQILDQPAVGGVEIPGPIGSGAADAAFAVLLERRERPTLEKQTFQMHMKKEVPLVLNNMKKSGLVAAYGGEGSDSEDDKESSQDSEKQEEKLVDVAKMACLLCKRQFPNKEALNKHVQLSNLHRNNLEALAKSKEAAANSAQQYRDRAKERREKYGQPNIPPPNKLKASGGSVYDFLFTA